ncbi:putative quinol monooxygenase [Pseudomonas sp. sia0905]|uniref:putative quinol monooxygenase n=1 Tax=Pseudomonas sp. sia0905 TaxID=2854783 RepID=UPI001C45472A|nr:antibiotic biosynthesis monooxygenase [Pseudomonas sp. sia0905]MBV7564708.1 antibiotic biosynthesis monooxygenase [Pseudomonas sp. sia0905]
MTLQTHITVLEAAPGRCEELGGYLLDLLEPTRRLDGCLAFELRRDRQRWQLHSRWRSPADLERYFAQPLLQEVIDSAWRSGAIQHLQSRAA